MPIKDNLNEQLSKITQIVGYIYASCLCSAKIPLRGYITTGKMHIDDDTVIGPALIEAHKFESKSANYPRICIDYNLVRTSESDQNNYQNAIFLDNDLLPCLNILKFINQEYLKAIKTSIYISLTEDICDLSSDVLPKRLWLINYVNEYYLQNFNERLFDLNKLGITNK